MAQPSATTNAVMSLTDVAALAHVRRSVVSMWRRRPVVRGELIPFPDPVQARAGVELFALADVVAWLEATGRGNNPVARADALAHARPLVSLEDATVHAAVESLLCLKACTGIDLTDFSAAEIVSEADEVDPHDDHLVSELLSAGDDLGELAEYAERLSDATWDAATAFERVRVNEAGKRSGMTAEALDVVGAIGAAIALDLGDDVVITGHSASDADLVDSVLTRLGEGPTAHVLVTGDSPAHRSARRLHWTRGRSVVSASPVASTPLVVAQVPRAGGSSDPGSVLAAADDLQLDLEDQQRALVIGPASVLCDELRTGELDLQRDHLIRLGRLRCAVRLPHGLVSDGSRSVFGLWALGDEPASIAVEARRLATADLTNESLRPDVVEDIATDVVASLTDAARATHAFRYARLHPTSTVLADRAAIITAGVGPERLSAQSGAASVVAIRQRLADLRAQPLPGDFLDGLTVEPGEGAATRADLTIDAAARSGAVRLLSGSRLPAVPQASAGVRVIDADAVRDPRLPRRGLDPLELEAIAPRARRTEPDDVVFCVSPRPAAIVDDEGLSVVAYPARVLRCTPGGGLVPEAVARAINDLPSASPRWRAWRIPRVPTEQAEDLHAVLRRLTAEEALARDRLSSLADLARELAHGVATGALHIAVDPQDEGL